MSPTKAVFQYEETLRTHLTRINVIHSWPTLSAADQALFKAGGEGTHAVETHETIFYAQGGGQPCDTGYMRVSGEGQWEVRFGVEAVRYGADGSILHFGRLGDGGASATAFAPGVMVEQHIDSERRDMNSRIHTAGHVVALAVRRLVEQTSELQATELKAQHYPDVSFVEFKGIIDGKHKDAIHTQSTEYVKQALPVRLYWYHPEELGENDVITAEGMPIVTGADGKVRVVDIVGAGAYPCGGTHVADTSYVGEIVVKGIKRQKGIRKISYAVKEKRRNLG